MGLDGHGLMAMDDRAHEYVKRPFDASPICIIKEPFSYLHFAQRIKAPTIMRIVWTKSVHITAVSPPAMVNTHAMAKRMRMAM